MQIVINPAELSYRDINTFGNALAKGQLEGAFNVIRPHIVSWELPIDLSGEDPFGEISVGQSGEVLRAIGESLKAYADSLEDQADQFKADLTKWNNRKMLDFQNRAAAGDLDTVEDAICELVSMRGNQIVRPLTLREGTLGMRAIMSAYQKALSGKN